MKQESKTLIIGAGISGLMAGKTLSSSGYLVTIIEKSNGVGGRMATRRFKGGVFDHGAQFFTARDPEFLKLVDGLENEGRVRKWSHGFPESGAMTSTDGHSRYMGIGGMTSIAKQLSQDLEVHLQTAAIAISFDGEFWHAQTIDGRVFNGDCLILTAPIPQSLSLLKAGGVSLEKREAELLKAIQYHPCLAALVVMDGSSQIPYPGGMKFESGPIQWLGDNTQKGISPKVTAVTIHASADFSHQNFEMNSEQIAESLIKAAKPWLGGGIQDWQLHKWRYSKPMYTYPERFLKIPGYPSLIFAGDAFGGPRVEGAALSGVAAAIRILEKN
jgi:predicted NAD/FAD-dependent oxidoreductase